MRYGERGSGWKLRNARFEGLNRASVRWLARLTFGLFPARFWGGFRPVSKTKNVVKNGRFQAMFSAFICLLLPRS
jgi:hypothetical protein